MADGMLKITGWQTGFKKTLEFFDRIERKWKSGVPPDDIQKAAVDAGNSMMKVILNQGIKKRLSGGGVAHNLQSRSGNLLTAIENGMSTVIKGNKVISSFVVDVPYAEILHDGGEIRKGSAKGYVAIPMMYNSQRKSKTLLQALTPEKRTPKAFTSKTFIKAAKSGELYIWHYKKKQGKSGRRRKNKEGEGVSDAQYAKDQATQMFPLFRLFKLPMSRHGRHYITEPVSQYMNQWTELLMKDVIPLGKILRDGK
jgi:hypothetical protein